MREKKRSNTYAPKLVLLRKNEEDSDDFWRSKLTLKTPFSARNFGQFSTVLLMLLNTFEAILASKS